MDKPALGNQEPLVVEDKVESPPGELGVSKYVECDKSSLQCFDTIGWGQEGHPACRKLDVGSLLVMI